MNEDLRRALGSAAPAPARPVRIDEARRRGRALRRRRRATTWVLSVVLLLTGVGGVVRAAGTEPRSAVTLDVAPEIATAVAVADLSLDVVMLAGIEPGVGETGTVMIARDSAELEALFAALRFRTAPPDFATETVLAVTLPTAPCTFVDERAVLRGSSLELVFVQPPPLDLCSLRDTLTTYVVSLPTAPLPDVLSLHPVAWDGATYPPIEVAVRPGLRPVEPTAVPYRLLAAVNPSALPQQEARRADDLGGFVALWTSTGASDPVPPISPVTEQVIALTVEDRPCAAQLESLLLADDVLRPVLDAVQGECAAVQTRTTYVVAVPRGSISDGVLVRLPGEAEAQGLVAAPSSHPPGSTAPCPFAAPGPPGPTELTVPVELADGRSMQPPGTSASAPVVSADDAEELLPFDACRNDGQLLLAHLRASPPPGDAPQAGFAPGPLVWFRRTGFEAPSCPPDSSCPGLQVRVVNASTAESLGTVEVADG